LGVIDITICAANSFEICARNTNKAHLYLAMIMFTSSETMKEYTCCK